MNYKKSQEEKDSRLNSISLKLQFDKYYKGNKNIFNDKYKKIKELNENENMKCQKIKNLKTDKDFTIRAYEVDERIKNEINNVLLGSDFLSDEMLTRAKVFHEVFFEEFFSIKCDNLIEKIEHIKIQGQKFIDVFMLFCLKKEIFEKYWEEFFDMALYIKEKKEVLESVPIEWIIDHIEDKPMSKRFLSVYEKPETMNGLKKYIIRYEKMLYDFFSKLLERNPQIVRSLLSEKEFNIALREDKPLGRKLILDILEVGGLGYINEKNINFLSDEQINLCYKEDYKKYLNDEVEILNKEIYGKFIGNDFKDKKIIYKDYLSKEVKSENLNENTFKSEETFSFDDGEFDEFSN